MRESRRGKEEVVCTHAQAHALTWRGGLQPGAFESESAHCNLLTHCTVLVTTRLFRNSRPTKAHVVHINPALHSSNPAQARCAYNSACVCPACG